MDKKVSSVHNLVRHDFTKFGRAASEIYENRTVDIGFRPASTSGALKIIDSMVQQIVTRRFRGERSNDEVRAYLLDLIESSEISEAGGEFVRTSDALLREYLGEPWISADIDKKERILWLTRMFHAIVDHADMAGDDLYGLLLKTEYQVARRRGGRRRFQIRGNWGTLPHLQAVDNLLLQLRYPNPIKMPRTAEGLRLRMAMVGGDRGRLPEFIKERYFDLFRASVRVLLEQAEPHAASDIGLLRCSVGICRRMKGLDPRVVEAFLRSAYRRDGSAWRGVTQSENVAVMVGALRWLVVDLGCSLDDIDDLCRNVEVLCGLDDGS